MSVALLTASLALTAMIVFLLAGLWHLTHLRELAKNLGEQGLLPRSLAWAVAIVTAAFELILGVIGALSFAHPESALWGAALVASGSLLSGYTLYLLAVRLRRREPAPCACAVGAASIGGVVLTRNVALIAALLLNGVLIVDPGEAPRIEQPLLVVLAAVSIALIVWVLPDALATPLEREEM